MLLFSSMFKQHSERCEKNVNKKSQQKLLEVRINSSNQRILISIRLAAMKRHKFGV